MPELPEVETVRRGLQPVMEGARIERVELRRKDLRFPFPPYFAERLAGKSIAGLARRAKYLLIDVIDAPTLICHLGMSGSFRIEAGDGEGLIPGDFHRERSKLAAHDHVVFHLTANSGKPARIIFNDPRRFGFMLFAEDGILNHPMLAGLGPEPTGNALDGAMLRDLLRNRIAPLKAALLDQKTIAGLGNIYVCEALWRAELSPARSASSIAGKSKQAIARSDALSQAIRAVIAEAIEAGGSSLRDHIQTDGSLGYFQHSFSVYDREGEPCRRLGCGGHVERHVQSGRSTFYCRSCQK
jgi:formamidopyrimidine-DNA glycosylase